MSLTFNEIYIMIGTGLYMFLILTVFTEIVQPFGAKNFYDTTILLGAVRSQNDFRKVIVRYINM